MSSDMTPETFSISTTSLYVTLDDELDYEVDTEYYLLLTVTDLGNSLTGYVAVRVNSKDLFVFFCYISLPRFCKSFSIIFSKLNIYTMYILMRGDVLSSEVTYPIF